MNGRLCAGALALAVAGCGCGGAAKNEATAPREAVEGYFHALGRGDYARACTFLRGDVQADVTRFVRTRDGTTTSTCDGALKRVFAATGAAPSKLAGTLGKAQVEKVEVDGDTAIATVEGASATVPLARVDGRWLITQLRQ